MISRVYWLYTYDIIINHRKGTWPTVHLLTPSEYAARLSSSAQPVTPSAVAPCDQTPNSSQKNTDALSSRLLTEGAVSPSIAATDSTDPDVLQLTRINLRFLRLADLSHSLLLAVWVIVPGAGQILDDYCDLTDIYNWLQLCSVIWAKLVKQSSPLSNSFALINNITRNVYIIIFFITSVLRN